MLRFKSILLASLLLGRGCFAVSISPATYLDDVKYLASDAMKGRGTGTPELDKAAKYIAQQFQKAHLKPIDGKSFYQNFTVSTNSHLGAANHLDYQLDGEKHALRFNQDFLPFNFSGSGRISGELVFAGYGITAREYNYDDYTGIDVKDKIVLVLRHEPQEFDAKSVFDGRVYTEHSQVLSKAVNAKLHGAKAILFVNDMAAHSGEDQLEKFSSTVSPGSPGIPFIQVKAEVVERWFQASGKSFRQVQEDIDREAGPKSFSFPASLLIDLQADVQRESRTVHNVAGFIPGETDEYVVVGAHYDHLGLGEQYSLAPDLAGTPHPGADDNASGTAGVLSLARWFGSQPRQKRGVLFMAFAGEELGLLGSSYYVSHATFPIEKAVAMINMDMIGRIREEKVYVGGAGTGSTFKSILDELKKRYPFQLDISEQGGYGSSDHTSFTTKQVPVLFFFSGLHADYHKPSDTWDKIDAKDAAKLLELIGDLMTRLADEPNRPQYVKVNEPHGGHAAGSSEAGSASGGYGPYFGSIPDFAEIPNGVRFADVRENSPAAKAGLKAGDILFEFDGKKIENLYDFTYALRSKVVGEVVQVQVMRGGKPVKASVVLEKRR
jgi:aminopeptidase YwaD